MATTKTVSKEIDIQRIETGSIDFYILGTTPTITSRMSQKAKEELLMPKGRKTAAERRGNVKHDVLQEYRDSSYISRDEAAPTYLTCLAAAFKQMMIGAATDMPGVAKTQVKRNLFVEGERLPLYGKPMMLMSVTRCADMNRTPDIRTRLIVPEWATKMTVTFVKPYFNAKSVTNLMAAAGITQGLGEWRPEKGSGAYGQFELCTSSDQEFKRRLKVTRQQQYDAVFAESPECYDEETEDLFYRYLDEMKDRGISIVGQEAA